MHTQLVKTLFLFLFTVTAFSENLNPTTIKSGDIIGVSCRRELTGFIVQAATQSSIDHAAIALTENGDLFIYHLTKQGLQKQSLTEFTEQYKAKDNNLYFAHSRYPKLTAEQLETIHQFIKNPPPQALSNVCTNFLQDAYKSAGISIGKLIPTRNLNTRAFGGSRNYWDRFFHGVAHVVPGNTLFENEMKLVANNVPLLWTEAERIAHWEKTADVSKVARIYLGEKKPTNAAAEEEMARKFFNTLKHESCHLEELVAQ